MKKMNFLTTVLAVAAALLYIRYQRLDIEIARFDCMMKVMKEEQRREDR